MSHREFVRAAILRRVVKGEISIREATPLLDVSYRQAKRLMQRFRAAGAKGLVHGNVGRRSNRQVPVQFPRGVIVIDGSQVEPDLMVRPTAPLRGWENAPIPVLVIEVLSRSTRRRDLNQKRDFYVRSGIDEYWTVDRNERALIRITASGTEPIRGTLTWAPRDIAATLDIDIAAMFAECLG